MYDIRFSLQFYMKPVLGRRLEEQTPSISDGRLSVTNFDKRRIENDQLYGGFFFQFQVCITEEVPSVVFLNSVLSNNV